MKTLFNILLAVSALLAVSCASHKVDVDSVAGLKEAKTTIDQAKKEGAKKYAPETLKAAEKTLDDAAKFVFQNSDMSAVEKQTDGARAEANRLLIITRESKKITDLSPEKVALEKEAEYTILRQPLNLKAAENEGFSDQFTNIDTRLKETARLSAQASANQKEIASMEPQKKFNERFEAASENFTDKEAEVLHSGNDIILRMKAIDFPTGSAEIAPRNYALLNKVQKTIKTFDPADVTIEGNTDSLGSPEKNKELSLDRANAVKEYLVENNTVAADKVKTLGMGADRPVASNKTAAGRAQNRRIDIVISPVLKAE